MSSKLKVTGTFELPVPASVRITNPPADVRSVVVSVVRDSSENVRVQLYGSDCVAFQILMRIV